MDDTDRRLNILFDQLNSDSIPKPVIDQLQEISKSELMGYGSADFSCRRTRLAVGPRTARQLVHSRDGGDVSLGARHQAVDPVGRLNEM